jgi:hypothetical protein
MPRNRSDKVFTERMELRVTGPMLADLQNVSTKNDQSIAAIVRQAIRNYLDDTDLTLGTRRTFDRRFQKRMEALEKMMERYLLTLLILCASQFAQPTRASTSVSGGDLIKESSRLAADHAGSQVRQIVLKSPSPDTGKATTALGGDREQA